MGLVLALRKRSILKFSLCLSRACLGKKIAFMHKWLKQDHFLTSRAA